MIINHKEIDVSGIEAKINKLENAINNVYPIGSIYTSVNNTNPSTLFGGTWERFGNGKVLVGVDENDTDFSTVEKTGGEKTHKLTKNEMPSHTHSISSSKYMVSIENSSNYAIPRGKVLLGTITDTYLTNSSTGGSQAHNNLQPYITVYMWKRVA